MKKVKVAFFAEILIEDSDGASRTMFQIIKRIDPQKFQFLFICGTGPEDLFGFECFRLPSVTIPVNANYRMALPQFARPALQQKLQSFAPDVVHIATPSLLGQFALKYALRNQLPVISIYHTHFISYIDYYLRYASFMIGFVKTRVASTQRSFYNHCDRVYIPSESIARELIDTGIKSSRIRIWKRGIDLTLFSPHKRDPAFIRKLTGNDLPAILFASRLVWEKNLDTLFRVYDLIVEKKIACNIIVAGDGAAMKACQSRMKEAVFVGKADHTALSVLYASSTVFLFPSVSETYGNVVIEAMASGLPCVIADGGGSKDFITQGQNGFKCEPCNAADYVAKIERLLQDKELREKFREEGLRYSRELDWHRLAQVYFNDVGKLALGRNQTSAVA